MARSLEPASGVLEGARDGQGLALIPQVGVQICPSHRTRVTPLRTRNRTPRASGTVSRQRIGAELPAAVRTPAQPLGAVFGTVDGHATAHDTRSALGLAVHRLRAARSGVLLQPQSGELDVAKLADGTAQNAGEGQMIRHHDARNLRAALVRARDRIMLAGVQMGLKKERSC